MIILRVVDANEQCLTSVHPVRVCVRVCVCICLCALSCAGDDLEPGLSGASDKEPGADHQPPHRRRSLHVFQHRRQPPRHHLQRQEGPPHGVALRKHTAGDALCTLTTLILKGSYDGMC